MSSPEVHSWFDPSTSTATHCIVDPATGRCAIVDPALDFDYPSGRTSRTSADAIADWIATRGLTLEWLLETHAHADHLSAAAYLRDRLGGRIAIGEHIAQVQRVFSGLLGIADVSGSGTEFDRLWTDGERFPIGSLEATVWHTPGHTPACVSYLIGDAVFVGDTLFAPDYGSARCDFPGGDAAALYRSVRRLYALDPATRIYLCHDYPPAEREPLLQTTIGRQRSHNVHLRDEVSENAFVELRATRDRTLGMPQLLWPSIQFNIRAGRFPPPEANGRRYLKVPLDAV
jgi:glyoxylase-like metal-dependent hydrolase (beta-lactamase superfamily II)